MQSSQLYSEIEISSEIMGASNHRLIQLLFERLVNKILLAKQFIEENNENSRNDCLCHANDIVLYLRACLNFQNEKVVELSSLLDTNYVFVEKCILNAMLKNDTTYLDLVMIVLNNIKSAWDEIAPGVSK